MKFLWASIILVVSSSFSHAEDNCYGTSSQKEVIAIVDELIKSHFPSLSEAFI